MKYGGVEPSTQGGQKLMPNVLTISVGTIKIIRTWTGRGVNTVPSEGTEVKRWAMKA